METAAPSGQISKPSRFRLPAMATFFSRPWWWTTLLVLIGIAMLMRLGVWQLDRLEQRRAHNAQILQQLALPPLNLTVDVLPADLDGLKNRQATVQREFDFTRQVALTQQNWMNTPGFHLITPLIIEGAAQSGDSRPMAVLVDRGWLPAAQQGIEDWLQYDVAGPVTVAGYVKLSQTLPSADDPNPAPGGLQRQWYRVDIAHIESQMPYELLPVYLQQAPSPDAGTSLPYRSQPDTDLSEGNHLSYAIQWFIFATILGIGYVYFVGKRTGETADGGHQASTVKR